MSRVKIEGNASGTGTFTIAAPNSNTDRTLTLPDEAGTVLTSASDITSQAGGITEIDMWQLTTGFAPSAGVTVITANLARSTARGFVKKGVGMSQSSGIFSFPSTGMWKVRATFQTDAITSASDYIGGGIQYTDDNWGGYLSPANWSHSSSGSYNYITTSTDVVFNVNDITNCKLKFFTECAQAGTSYTGHATSLYTYFSFIRLGDST